MARSWVLIHRLVAIILLALILVHYPKTDWRTQCDAKLSARLDFYTIFLIARSCDGGLAGSPASHLGLDVGFGEGHAWRAAVDNGADRETVGLSIAADCKSVP